MLKPLFAIVASLLFFSCTATLPMRQGTAPAENHLAALKVSAYAIVNSPKQTGEVYVSKDLTSFVSELGIWKLALDPKDFHNAYTVIEVSVGKITPKGLQQVQILLQGENFSDGYRTNDLATEKGTFVCNGDVAEWDYQGVANSSVSGMSEPVDIKLVFRLIPEMQGACHP